MGCREKLTFDGEKMNKPEAKALATLVAKVSIMEKILIATQVEEVQVALIKTFAEIEAKINELYKDEPVSNLIVPGMH